MNKFHDNLKIFAESEVQQFEDEIPKKMRNRVHRDKIMYEISDLFEFEDVPEVFYFNIKLYLKMKPRLRNGKAPISKRICRKK